MRFKTYALKHAENGFILTTTYHFKPSAKDPGHNRERVFVAGDVGELMDVLQCEIDSPAIVVEGETP
jgi:hypothetical protein